MTTTKSGIIGILLLFLTACQTAPIAPLSIEKPRKATSITDQRLPEISGLAASTVLPSHLWAINDSGNDALIYLIDENLSVTREISLNIRNRDWEDLAAFSLDGVAWIVIAESGDNLYQYASYQLHFYRETDLLNSDASPLSPKKTVSYSYEQGSVNCEAIAVDAASGIILLFAKTVNNTPVFNLPLSVMQASGSTQAKLLATIPAYANNPANSFISALTGVNLDATTAATIPDDGENLFLLTYNDIWRINRDQTQSWREALQSKAKHFASHDLHQAEALASDSNNHKLLVSSEVLPAPVLEFKLKYHQQ